MNPIILIMTLNMNGLNIPIKIHGLKNNNHDPTVHCQQETHSILKDISRFELTKERINDLENKSIKIMKSEEQELKN